LNLSSDIPVSKFAFKFSVWFQPLNLKCDFLVSKFVFKMGQLVPLPLGVVGWAVDGAAVSRQPNGMVGTLHAILQAKHIQLTTPGMGPCNQSDTRE
jgi:hypothetical protein